MSTMRVYKGDTYAIIEESWLRDFEAKGWSAKPSSTPMETRYAARVATIITKASRDLGSVSRDDLVMVARSLDLDPPDRGPKSSKAAIFKLISDHYLKGPA